MGDVSEREGRERERERERDRGPLFLASHPGSSSGTCSQQGAIRCCVVLMLR